ncbi:MAG: class I tRNA ligase family protein, partial [Alphaproteobacteria bacterium]
MSSDTEVKDGRDYRDTIFLPKTDFPMRAGLPKKEPEWLEKWARQDIYNSTLNARADEGAKPFVYHDGPPYANGNLHLGHALNKILKDLVCRSQNMLGKRAPFIPGWDCHGLPIEWKIEEQIRAEGKQKEDVSTAEFRQRCRDFAAHWVDVQREEFKRLGVSADWDNPYLTMTEEAEAAIAAEFQKFLMDGSLYRGAKPVMWSVIEKTALAEAEVEYHDHKSITIFVRFPVVKTDNTALEGTSIVIWTTTPWTIPGNRAIAASSNIDYGIYEVGALGEHSKAVVGEKIVLADALAESVRTAARIEEWTRLGDAGDVIGAVCAHPFAGSGYDFDVPVLDGDHVTTETGTGFVHTAPGHGVEDYEVCQKHGGIEIPFTVEADGTFAESVPLFAGEKVLSEDGKDWPANIAVLRQLAMHEKLLAKGKISHS